MRRAAASRRGLLLGVGATAVLAGGAVATELPRRVARRLGLGPDLYLPDAPAGAVRLEKVFSQARGRDVDLFTAVPAGHGDGAGLPVVVVLHGASATAADFEPWELPRFLTAAVEAGARPFVLAGADGGVLRWEPDPNSSDDPQRMLLDELPRWLTDRGFDVGTRALWGWSMGGYGALRAAAMRPEWARAVAAFSPALTPDDYSSDFSAADVTALGAVPLGVWCGLDDPYHDATRDLVGALSTPPEVTSFGPGGHTREYWNDHTLDAFAFLAGQLG